MFTIESSRELLKNAKVFFDCSDPDDDPMESQMLNLNDAFYWACSDGEHVADKELARVAELFWTYGYAGIMYWVIVEKRGKESVEFVDVNRKIEFVKNEEAIRKEEPSSSKRAYLKRQYTIGVCE